jgi:two-component sensor histidine kinase
MSDHSPVRDTHHRTKNDLQGIAALLRYTTPTDPVAAGAIVDAVARIQSIAIVHGLQMGDDDQVVPLIDLLGGIASNAAQALSAEEPAFDTTSFEWMPQIRASDAVALSLATNELAMHALRQRAADTPVHGRWSCSGDSILFSLMYVGSLPPGFTLETVARSMTGLGLVKSLLPRNGTRLAVMRERERVVLQLSIGTPVLVGAVG